MNGISLETENQITSGMASCTFIYISVYDGYVHFPTPLIIEIFKVYNQ